MNETITDEKIIIGEELIQSFAVDALKRKLTPEEYEEVFNALFQDKLNDWIYQTIVEVVGFQVL